MDFYSLSIVKSFIVDSIVLNDSPKEEKLSYLLSYVDSLFIDDVDDSSRIELIKFTQSEIDKFYSYEDVDSD